MTQALSSLAAPVLYPATAAQARFWYLDAVTPGSTANTIAVQWQLTGIFADESLQAAFDRVIARHEILRTSFVEQEGEIFQSVADKGPFRLAVIDVRGLPAQERDAKVRNIATSMAAEPFDLSKPGLLRATLVRVASDRSMLCITAHHAVFDGFSIRVLGREIGQCLAAIETGGEADLPDLALQYGDYAAWQKALEESGAHVPARAYWAEVLDDFQYFEIPPDHAGACPETRVAGRHMVDLSADFAETLAETARRHNLSSFALGSAVTAAVLQRWSGADDVSFGSAFAGRTDPALEASIGVFINPIVLRYRLDGDATLATVIDRAKTVVPGALAHGDYPFDVLMRDRPRSEVTQRTPMVSVFFGLQTVFLEEESYGPISIASIPSIMPDITHDLNILVIGRGAGWKIILDYDQARFAPETIAAFADALVAGFDQADRAPEKKLCDLAFAADRRDPAPHERREAPATEGAAEDSAQALDEGLTQRLHQIWTDCLPQKPTSAETSFFDLGGHSLLSLKMLSAVDNAFGVRPSIAAFLADPTLGGLANTINRLKQAGPAPGEGAAWTMISLNKAPAAQHLVVSINQPFLYQKMSQAFGDTAETVNLHLADARRVEGHDPQVLDALAAAAAAQIAAAAADRTVTLIGHCVDGAFALRVAGHMQATGVAPDRVAMIDTWLPGTFQNQPWLRRTIRRHGSRLRRWWRFARQVMQGDMTVAEFLAKNRRGRAWMARLGKAAPETEDERREIHINHRLVALTNTAQLVPYTGRVIQFATGSQPARARAQRFGWGDLLPADTPVFRIPGWHEDALMRRGVEHIAEILKTDAARAR